MTKRQHVLPYWITPAGISVALFLLGMIYNELQSMRVDMIAIKERLTRVETTLQISEHGKK